MNVLLHTSHPSDITLKPVGARLDPMEALEDMFDWLAVLWQRGLCHDNPQGKHYIYSYKVITQLVSCILLLSFVFLYHHVCA